MSFAAEWLSLRRAADARSRDNRLAQRLAEHLAGRDRISVVDLGAGTGANIAWLAPKLPAGQHWRLVDHDASLLGDAEAPDGVAIERIEADLSGDLAPLFEPAPDLVTASAFFDLCGAEVADAIVAATIAARAAFLTVLTYDGDQFWSPPHPRDAAVHAAFDAHQRLDKGLGPALGPDATSHLAAAFRAGGYRVELASTPWNLAAPGDAALIGELARGTGAAVGEAEWAAAQAEARGVRIGHHDLLALPGYDRGPEAVFGAADLRGGGSAGSDRLPAATRGASGP